jgi:hypothetical protein
VPHKGLPALRLCPVPVLRAMSEMTSEHVNVRGRLDPEHNLKYVAKLCSTKGHFLPRTSSAEGPV